MTKKQIKYLAKIYSASVVCNSLGTGAGIGLMSDENHKYFCREVHRIAIHMVMRMRGGSESLLVGDLEGLIQYTKQQTK